MKLTEMVSTSLEIAAKLEEINQAIEKAREDIERVAMLKIQEIVKDVEEQTGRRYYPSVPPPKLGKSTEKELVFDQRREHLRNHIRRLGAIVRTNYSFDTPCQFRKWTETYFKEGWKNPDRYN